MQICELSGVFLIRAWSFRLSILYQFGLLLYCRYFDVKIELDTCVGSWLSFNNILLGYCGVSRLFCVLFMHFFLSSVWELLCELYTDLKILFCGTLCWRNFC